VGESGCGKTTVAKLVLGLVPPTSGRIFFDGADITEDARARSAARPRMQIVFQDPFSSLDPRFSVLRSVSEPIVTHARATRSGLRERVSELLQMVGLEPDHMWRRPHEFSGGQCQRIAIARALALNPPFVILDEPTSSLDVSVQARILKLLARLQEELGLTYLFITHDLAVVDCLADRVLVMYLGRVVEEGPVSRVFGDPLHPYTRALLEAAPSPDPERRSAGAPLPGNVPSAIDVPQGCRFHTRCPEAASRCREDEPELVEVTDGRRAACHLVVESGGGPN